MEKVKLFLMVLLCIILFGCSSGILEPELDSEYECSSDDMLMRYQDKYEGYLSSSNECPESRSSANTITLYGYSSIVSDGRESLYIQKDLADLIGISSKTYIAEYITAYQYIKVEGLGTTTFFSTANSPLCGSDPSAGRWSSIGYAYIASSSSNNQNIVKLESRCIHVICDISGRNYDKWYPRKPEDFQWNYILINM